MMVKLFAFNLQSYTGQLFCQRAIADNLAQLIYGRFGPKI